MDAPQPPPQTKAEYQQWARGEYSKCLQNPAYFMRYYCKIQHPVRGTIPFALFPFQEETLTQFKLHSKNIVLKSRQLGISTLVAGYSLWLMTFFSDKNVLVIATKQSTAKELVTKVRFMNDSLPKWLRVEHKENNKLSLKLENGSKIEAVASAKDAGRSAAVSLLVLDECAFIASAEDIWTAAFSTISTGGRAILLSTPNGIGNFFHKMWIEAEENKNGFNTIKLDWKLHPERNQKWRDEQTQVLGPLQAIQECDCTFHNSGNTVFHADTIDWYERNHVCEPVEKRGRDHSLWIWKYRQDFPEGTQFVVSADVARGDGSDYSAFHVFEPNTLEQVAEFEAKIDTNDYARVLISIATEYNDGLLIIERENVGWAVIQAVINLGYKNLFYGESGTTYVDVNALQSNKLNQKDRSKTAGFTTSHVSRPLVISSLDEYLGNKQVIFHSARLINQMKVFIWGEGGKSKASPGFNDDLIMSAGIGLWVRDTALKLMLQQQQLTRLMLGKMGKSDPWKSDQFKPIAPVGPGGDPFKMYAGTGQPEDLRWLL